MQKLGGFLRKASKMALSLNDVTWKSSIGVHVQREGACLLLSDNGLQLTMKVVIFACLHIKSLPVHENITPVMYLLYVYKVRSNIVARTSK